MYGKITNTGLVLSAKSNFATIFPFDTKIFSFALNATLGNFLDKEKSGGDVEI